MPRVQPADIDKWINAYLRQALIAEDEATEVGDQYPDDLKVGDGDLIVIRVDQGAKLSQVSFDCSIGVTVLIEGRQNIAEAKRRARLALGILSDDAIALAAGSPIVSVEPGGINGPYAVTERQDFAAVYFTCQYVTVGEW